MYKTIQAKSVSLNTLNLCSGDFEKALKYEQMSKNFAGIEKEHYDNLLRINQCVDIGSDIPNECISKLEKCLNHFQKHQNQYMAIGLMTMAVLSASFVLIPGSMPTTTVVLASTAMPSVNMGTVTAMLTKLVSNLITLGAMLVSASCVIDMIKSIVQGNVSHLPKSLITHGLMVCSLFVSPMVFEAISKAFGV